MIDEKYAHRFAQDLMQEISYKIGDALSGVSTEATVFAVAAMHVICVSLEAQLDGSDRQLLGHLVDHTTAVVLPYDLDPRKQEGGQ